MFTRQLSAAWARSVAANPTCTSFSASAKVAGDTSGPTAGPVPNAGGAPGGSWFGCWALLIRDAVAAISPSEVRVKNCLRDFDMCPPGCIVAES
jgi:hypothetical protein